MLFRPRDVQGRHYNKLLYVAVELLQKCARLGKGKPPHYDHQASISRRKPGYVYHCRFNPPRAIFDFVKKEYPENTVVGVGGAKDEHMAKNYAALECMFRLDAHLGRRLEGALIAYEKDLSNRMGKLPIEEELPGVSWENWPIDRALARRFPATRYERLEFGPMLAQSEQHFLTAKAITLASTESLPEVLYKKNIKTKRLTHCNIKTNKKRRGIYSARGLGEAHLKFTIDTIPEMRRHMVLLETLEKIYQNMQEEGTGQHLLKAASLSPSFGQAKLFVTLPTHHLAHLTNLLFYMRNNPLELPEPKRRQPKKAISDGASRAQLVEDETVIARRTEERIATLRQHQQMYPLPVDDVEAHIPFDRDVTIVKGGTGSGKTTRYPLMLSLFAAGNPKVVVAQPRRLACVTAAERVAYEQGFLGGGNDGDVAAAAAADNSIVGNECPIGYAIRFDAHLAPATASRTVDFCTPGVLLRRAMTDPLFENVSHLVIDEIHERNADVDLLCSLAKQAVKVRRNHPTLPPLRLVLMSATVDSSAWERYFEEVGFSVATVQVPEVRRFPIDIVHLDDANFPRGGKDMRSLTALEETKREELSNIDDALCRSTAELVLHLFRTDDKLKEGATVLCFLPGMDEIKAVDRYLRKFNGGKRDSFAVRYLHSSVSAQDQRLAFELGRPKVVLATNIAETSLTIADVKYVIDSGRERQHSLLDSTSTAASANVVGSQLTIVDISQASASQRAGRAGRVCAGTCYRLYRKSDFETLLPHTIPEMLRMDLSQLVLHALSFNMNEEVGHPLELLLAAPDPPTETNMKQCLVGLKIQGLVHFDAADDNNVRLTELGRVVSAIPATPRIGRMLFMGLVLRALEPALRIAAILSVPKLFGVDAMDYSLNPNSRHCSDVVELLEEYQSFLDLDAVGRRRHTEKKLFEQVSRVKTQLEKHMLQFMRRKADASSPVDILDAQLWNANSDRTAAVIGLVCSATPHIAHLVRNDNSFTTRNVAEQARIHPSSVNHEDMNRVAWYCYNELRVTTKPYLLITTAVSPLDLALFSDASDEKLPAGALPDGETLEISNDEWLFLVDEWVPVSVADLSQRRAVLMLRKMLTKTMPEQVAVDPARVLACEEYEKIVLFAISAIEQERMGRDYEAPRAESQESHF